MRQHLQPQPSLLNLGLPRQLQRLIPPPEHLEIQASFPLHLRKRGRRHHTGQEIQRQTSRRKRHRTGSLGKIRHPPELQRVSPPPLQARQRCRVLRAQPGCRLETGPPPEKILLSWRGIVGQPHLHLGLQLVKLPPLPHQRNGRQGSLAQANIQPLERQGSLPFGQLKLNIRPSPIQRFHQQQLWPI